MRAKASILFGLLCVVCVGCKASPAKPSGYLNDYDRMKKDKEIPFHTSWRADSKEWTQYDRVWVAPVDADNLLEADWWDKFHERGEENIKKDIQELATWTRTQIQDAFRNAKENNRYKVSGARSGKKVLILEFAVVEVIPSKSVLEAISWAIPFVGSAITQTTKSSAAMEGRFRDGGTGEIIMTFKDREGEQARPVDIAGLTWYAHARGILQDWAAQLVQVANKKEGEVIKDTKVFTLSPW